MKKRLISLFIAVVAIFALATTAFAGPGGGIEIGDTLSAPITTQNLDYDYEYDYDYDELP
jgi:hypothetical protein